MRRDLPIISIVGYTNAGKSTLLNALTTSTVTAEDRMFATLDPTSRRLRLPRDQEVIINDTVGFIRDLPPDLITAFRATLEEMEGSDVLIHLVDGSSAQMESHIASVEKILADLNLASIPRLLVINKSDLLSKDEKSNLTQAFNAVMISAIDPRTLVLMVERVGSILEDKPLDRMPSTERRQSAITT
jgi:GTP-binding protein HflX